MTGWLRFLGWVGGTVIGLDGLIRIFMVVERFDAASRLPPAAAAPIKEVLWAATGVGTVEIILALIVMTVCLAIATILDRLPQTQLQEQRVDRPITGPADRPAPVRPNVPSRPGPQIGEGKVEAAPFRWPD